MEAKKLQTKRPNVWVITTSRAGDDNNRRGIANELCGQHYREIKVKPMDFQTFDEILDANFPDMKKSDIPWPDVILAREEDALFMMRVEQISKKNPVKVIVLSPVYDHLTGHIMASSGFRSAINSCDLAVGYEHQHIEVPGLTTPILRCKSVPSLVTPKNIADNAAEWEEHLSTFDKHKPIHALLVVGDIDVLDVHIPFTEDSARELGRKASSIVNKTGGTLLVTNSRRTSEKATHMLMDSIRSEHAYLFKWHPDKPDPYFAFLNKADEIIVTGDSLSMCSDALCTGKPLYIHAPPGSLTPVHQRFVDMLYKEKLAKPLEELELHGHKPWTYKRLVPAKFVANEIRNLLIEKQNPPGLPGH